MSKSWSFRLLIAAWRSSFFLREIGPGVLEVEPGQDLPIGLVVRVLDLVEVDFEDHVEGELVLGHADNLAARCGGRARSRRAKGRCYPGPGRVPERPKGAVCKIAGVAYAGSNPAPPTTRSAP